MTPNARKKQFIKNIGQYNFDFTKKKDIDEELLKLFKSDSPDLKLYKYRAFDDKGYSLSNLKDQTLYCSKRSQFNDPFDTKVGIDGMSFLLSLFGIEQNNLSKLFEEFSNKLLYDECSNDLTREETNIINRWMESEPLKKFIFRLQNEDIETNKIKKKIFRNPDIIFDLIVGATTKKEFREGILAYREEYKKKFSAIIPLIPVTTEKNLFHNIAKSKGITAKGDDISVLNRLCKLEDKRLNNEIEDLFNEYDSNISGFFDRMIYIGCLCTSYTHRLMWSHYADGHKGFCVEYDYSKRKDEDIIPFPVVYSKDRIPMPWEIHLHHLKYDSNKFAAKILEAILTKDSEWKYENEWRIIIEQDNNSQNFKMPPISCVYLGALCSEENKNKILDIARENNFVVKQMSIDRGKFDLHEVEIFSPNN